MSIFNKKNENDNSGIQFASTRIWQMPAFSERKILNSVTEPEEWVWVEGFKGTDKDMKCRGYQFELNKQFDMPEGAEIRECQSGFHLCLKLQDVFDYYSLSKGNRYFKVRALVRAKDIDLNHEKLMSMSTSLFNSEKDKLTSKSIIFLKEVGIDDIFDAWIQRHPDHSECAGWTTEEKEIARQKNPHAVDTLHQVQDLITLGFSPSFAEMAVEEDYYKYAKAAGSQEGLSMDMKVFTIFRLKAEHDSVLGTISWPRRSNGVSVSYDDYVNALYTNVITKQG